MSTEAYDVIVIGAGFAGLSAGYNIKKRNPDISVLVLEAKDRMGGRTQTVQLNAATGLDTFDVGGQWLGGTCQANIMKLVKEFGIETYKQYKQGKNLIECAGKPPRTYSGEIPDLTLPSLLDIGWTMYKTNQLANQIDVYDPMSHPRAKEWDAISAEDYYAKTMYTREAYECMLGFIRGLFGTEANQCSFIYTLYYINLAGSLEKVIGDGEGTAQSLKIKGGAAAIYNRLASHIGNDNVKLNEPVVAISQDDKGATVTTKSGLSVRSNRVILAVPPKFIGDIEHTPRLPQDRVDFMKRMPLGSYIKVIAIYREAFWKETGYSGLGLSSGLPFSSNGLKAPINFWFDTTTMNGNAALALFIGGQIAVEWMMRPAQERKNGVLEHLALLYDNKAAYSPLHYEEKNWSFEPYSHGCPTSPLTTGSMDNFSRCIRRVEGRLHFAGTETALSWPGYIEGAVQSGERAALEVLSHISPKALSDKDKAQLDHNKRRYESMGKNAKKGRSFFKTVLYTSVGIAVLSAIVFGLLNYLNVDIGKLT